MGNRDMCDGWLVGLRSNPPPIASRFSTPRGSCHPSLPPFPPFPVLESTMSEIHQHTKEKDYFDCLTSLLQTILLQTHDTNLIICLVFFSIAGFGSSQHWSFLRLPLRPWANEQERDRLLFRYPPSLLRPLRIRIGLFPRRRKCCHYSSDQRNGFPPAQIL